MFKDKWVDKINDKDYVDAEDINSIARAVIDIENSLEKYDKDVMALLGSDEP